MNVIDYIELGVMVIDFVIMILSHFKKGKCNCCINCLEPKDNSSGGGCDMIRRRY